MTVTNVVKDPERRTMTITAEFGAPVERVWQIWADPRQLERWWGPPTYPATVVDHDLAEGGTVNYFMTGPDGDKHAGWWRVSAIAPLIERPSSTCSTGPIGCDRFPRAPGRWQETSSPRSFTSPRLARG